MAEAPVGNVESTNFRQEVSARFWVWRIGRRCEEWFLQSKCRCLCVFLGFMLVVIILAFVVKGMTSHQGKFPPEQCSSEWIGYKSKCYFISEEEKNWTSSQIFCAENESLLAVFENQEEMHSLTKHLKIEDSWIGLRKKGENFYWENGVALKVDSFQIRNHSECAYLDVAAISTSACSLPRRCICVRLP